jgi:hypothetical protein
MVVDYEHCLDCINDSTHYILTMIVESLWLYPILGIVGLAILYWFN